VGIKVSYTYDKDMMRCDGCDMKQFTAQCL